MTKKRWSNQALTSLLSLWSFLIMALTGIVLYFVPHGRIAYWTDWKFIGLTKTQCGNIHTLTMVLFLVTIAIHIYFNWKPLIGYFKSRATRKVFGRWEIAVSLVISALFVVSAINETRPLGYLLEIGEDIKDSWVNGPKDEPPFGHAELLKLGVLCKKSNIPVDAAMKVLEEQGLVGVRPDRVLAELAEENDMSPRDVFMLIVDLEVVPEVVPPPEDTGMTAEYVEETFAGTGIGRKTIEQVAGQLKLDPDTLRQQLDKKGLTYEDGQSIKQISNDNDIDTPIEVLKLMLVGD